MTSRRTFLGTLACASAAKKLNASVSVRVNMSDAYETSPLWQEYRETTATASSRSSLSRARPSR